MFPLVIGLPGRFTDRCEALVLALAERALGPTGVIRAERLEQIAISVLGTGASRAVVSSRQGGGRRLRAVLLETGQNFIVAVDEPRKAVAHLIADERVPIAEAVRCVASSCGALAGYVA